MKPAIAPKKMNRTFLGPPSSIFFTIVSMIGRAAGIRELHSPSDKALVVGYHTHDVNSQQWGQWWKIEWRVRKTRS